MNVKKTRSLNWLNWVLLLVMFCTGNILAEEALSREHDSHDDEQHELEVELSAKAVKISGITFDEVKSVKIAKTIELAGEVDFDQERVAHVVPRFPGIVLAAEKKVGDFIKAGTVLASIESNESLNKYQVKSLISGTVIEKHVTLGEFISEGSTIYVIADLSQVWVNLEVYAKDAEQLQIGQKVSIETIGNHHRADGEIAYIKPVYSEHTRSLIARVILPNPEQKWRPGAFVRGIVFVEAKQAVNVVLKDAIQTIKEKTYVFIPETEEENTFRAVEVKTGEGGRQYVQVLSGISLGDTYVSKGAFELKAELTTGSLTGHAGHGH